MLAAALAFAPVAAAAEESAPGAAGAPPTVAVVGQASEDAKPDVATVSLSIEVEKPTAAEAANENARRAEAVIAGLKAAGVDAKDIATVGLSLYPVWNNVRASRAVVSAYQATNRIAVRVQPLDKAGALIAQAVAERRRIPGRRLRRLRPRGARGRAAHQGGRERRASRRALCARRGDEARAAAVDPRRRGAAGRSGRSWSPPAASAAGAPTPPPIEPGLITLSETVSASWALAPQ